MNGIFKDDAYYPLGLGEEISEGEYEYQYELCNEVWYETLTPRGYWRTRSGTLLTIAEMSNTHLDNAIKLFVKTDRGDHAKIRELKEELFGRAES